MLLLSILCVAAWLALANAQAADATGPTVEVPRAQPEPFRLVWRQAQESFDRGNYSEAERLYAVILAANPHDAYALASLGVTRFRLGKLVLAEDSLRWATTLAPHDAFNYVTLGTILYFQGKLAAAIDCYHCALDIDPQNASARKSFQMVEQQKLHPNTTRPLPNVGDFLTPLEEARLSSAENA